MKSTDKSNRKHTIIKKIIKIFSVIFFIFLAFFLCAWINSIENSKGFTPYKYNENLNLSDDLQKIIYYGTLAANSHNSQMWKVKVIKDDTNNKQIIVRQDKTRLLLDLDTENRETMICIGAFISNIKTAAKALGYDVSMQVMAKNYFDDDIASLTLIKNTTSSTNTNVNANTSTNIFNIMSLTDANRKDYIKNPLSVSDISYIRSVDPNHILYYSNTTEEGKYIANAIINATSDSENNEKIGKQQSEWMRFSNKQAFSTKDGLTPEMLAQPMIVREFIYTIKNKNIMKTKAFKNDTIKATKKQTENCAGFYIITSDNQSVESLLNVGKDLQLLWFKATEKNISMHPMTISLLISPYKDNIANDLEIPDQHVNMILRAGYVKKIPYPVSMRRSISEIIE